MIRKFIKISGTGRFLNYNHTTTPSGFRTTEFERLNLIYGENGSGKTTLSNILRSIRGDNSLLPKLRSFDRSISQSIEVLTNETPDPNYRYVNSMWNKYHPNIEIFDTHFINENIFTGLEIQTSHKKNLFEVIFGQEGVKLKVEIQEIKDKIQSVNRFAKETAEKIQLGIDQAFTASLYCNLPTDSEIDTKISKKEQEIATAKSYEEIKSKSVLSTISFLKEPIARNKAVELLSKSIETISQEYLSMVQSHKESLDMKGGEEDWIKKGFNSIIDDKCPFCLRPIDNSVKIIEAYKQYFNEEYNALLNSISTLTSEINNFNPETNLLQIEAKIAANNRLLDFWKNHIMDAPVLASLIHLKDELIEAHSKAQKSIEKKSKNPIQQESPNDIIALLELIDSINDIITKYDVAISLANIKISEIKNASRVDINALELEMKKLRAIKKKSDPVLSKLCNDLKIYSKKSEEYNELKTAKQKELDDFTTTIFTKYSSRINYYLHSFAPYLEIRNLDSGYVGSSKEPQIKFALHINGNEIKQDESAAFPCFKYSFSEGDKSAMALAFFLTKLEVDGNLQDKIIVFDDPVSSFDLNRKSTTISNLLNFGQQAKQLFIFTHNLIFACEFWKSANQLPYNAQCTKIEFLGTTACLVEYNIETETISSILKDSLAIKEYLTNGCITDQLKRSIAKCLRPAIESYFHLKFFDLVSPNDWLGDFIDMIRKSISSDPYFRLQGQLQTISDINDYSKKYHHRFNANNETEPVNDTELRSYCTRTLDLIQVI